MKRNPTLAEWLANSPERPVSLNRRKKQKLLDNPKIRAALVKRVERAIRRPDIPVMVLHQVAQCIEMWDDDDKED